MTDEFRMTIERRCADGAWEGLGTVTLGEFECEQLVLLLAGVDLAAYATMSLDEQERVDSNIANARPLLPLRQHMRA